MMRNYGLTMEDLEEALSEILPPGFEIKIIKNKVVIATNLVENSYGELVSVEAEDSDEEDLDQDDLEDIHYLNEEDLDLQSED